MIKTDEEKKMIAERNSLIRAAIDNGDLEFKTYEDFEDETEKEINEEQDAISIYEYLYEAGTVLRKVDPSLFREIVLERLNNSKYVDNPAHVWGENMTYIKEDDLADFLATHEALKGLKDTSCQ